MSEVKLLPLPESDGRNDIYGEVHDYYYADTLRSYARANMAELLAENERLRAKYQLAAESSEHFAARAERLAEALRHTKEKLEHVAAIRGGHGTFAGTYLIVTEALDQARGKGCAGK